MAGRWGSHRRCYGRNLQGLRFYSEYKLHKQINIIRLSVLDSCGESTGEMSFLDFFKGKILDIPDAINRKLSPRDPFTRKPHIVDPAPLHEKAATFWAQVQMDWRHGDGGEFYKYADPFDGGDSAFFHGHYTMTCALRRDWAELQLALIGLEKYVCLGKNDRLSRGVDLVGGPMVAHDPNRKYFRADDYIYHQNCSESSLIGVILSCFSVLLVDAPKPARERATKILDRLAKQIIRDGFRLLDEDGAPAKFGDLRPEFSTAPIRLGALAALLILAYTMTGDSTYRTRYEKVVGGRMGTLTHQETHFLWIYPWYQTVLAYCNYAVLAYLDRDRAADFQRAMELLYLRTRDEGNALYTFLAKLTLGKIPLEYRDQAKKTLSEFNTDRELGPTGKGQGAVDLRGTEWDPGFRWGPKWLRGGRHESRQPIPVSLRPSADYFWQRNPYSLHGHADHRYNALDFCQAYYLGVETRSL